VPGRGSPPDEGDGGGGDRGDDRGPGPDGADGFGSFALGLALIGIATLFLVLLAVCVFLRRPALDWGAFHSPALEALWVSTACLAASSAALEASARAARRAGERPAAVRWLVTALLLGATFLAAQVLLWIGLVRAGLVPASSGYAAVFFALTSLHALHVLGGLGFLAALVVEARVAGPRPVRVRLAAVYWHFMGAIWLVLFALLYFVR